MSKAQEAASKAFPGEPFIHDRCVFRMGYEQAEKDLALTTQDMRTIYDLVRHHQLRYNDINGCLPDVLKLFNKRKYGKE